MIRAVLDTNVLLASLLSKKGASFELVQRLTRLPLFDEV
jgi:predicted nucleic acid-binding protein